MPFSKFLEKWKNYRFRFVPWIILNLNKRLQERSTRVVPSSHADCLIPPEKLEQVIRSFLTKLKNFDSKGPVSLCDTNRQVMLQNLGFAIQRRPSLLAGGGLGVFVTEGCAKKGSLVALYPGTIYRPYEPIFLPSLRNSFVFRCLDGTHIDGKDCGLSKIIFRSVAGRDRMGPAEVADTSWIGNYPKNPLSIGQYVNNSNREMPCNVAYQECDLPSNFPASLLALLPYAHYSPGGVRRIVALIATTDIRKDSEILSSYYTLVGDSHQPSDKLSD